MNNGTHEGIEEWNKRSHHKLVTDQEIWEYWIKVENQKMLDISILLENGFNTKKAFKGACDDENLRNLEINRLWI